MPFGRPGIPPAKPKRFLAILLAQYGLPFPRPIAFSASSEPGRSKESKSGMDKSVSVYESGQMSPLSSVPKGAKETVSEKSMD